MRVLVVDDEPSLLSFLVPLLQREGFDTDTAATGTGALAAIAGRRPDLVLLDVGLPDMSGLAVCREIRRDPAHLPVIMLTGLNTREDELAGFAAAADDYIRKPFEPETLIARIRAVLRLSGADDAHLLLLGNVEIDLRVREARRNGESLGLKPKEFELLAFLVSHRGQVFGKTQLLSLVWGPDFDGDPHTVAVHISRLRAAVEPNPNRPTLLLTRSNVGYYVPKDDPQ